ncbi:cytochrome P450 [Lentinula lateritia]|uniref:Cytochrome P450 n=1 Tax=Lentinula lateritia TaxID=40482 RepID=A0ABQ8UYW8_9AGAR|nr:cytochrome P450 [Lentinula lateritia]
MHSTAFVTDIVIGLFALFILHRLSRRLYRKYPPGPPKLPLIGNLLQIELKAEWVTYHQWALKYESDIIHLSIAGLSVVILDTLEAVYDLLDKRSSIYSDRPRMVMLNEMIGWSWAFPFRSADHSWREQRRVIHHEFHPKAVTKYRPVELKAVHNLLKRLHQYPDSCFIGEIILTTIYGIAIKSSDDPFVATAIKAMEVISLATSPGQFLVESLPILRYIPAWFPYATFKRQSIQWQQNAIDAFTCTFNAAHQDSNLSVLRSFMLEMMYHPEVQVKAQKEIDIILKGERLPLFSDIDSLPYITAIMKEILRFSPVAPLSAPHATNVDDVYNGYFIPAGSVILPNTWAILHDPKSYHDPFTFNPERFLKNEKLNPNVLDPFAVFGYGRRICPGRHMVIDILWITMASILAVFCIQKTHESTEEDANPSHPLPFNCRILPRSSQHLKLILEN